MKTWLNFVILGLMISLAGSIVFLTVTAPESYIIFLLYITTTAAIVSTISGKAISLMIGLKWDIYNLHILLILAAFALIIMQIANIYFETLKAILYVIVFIFGLGFSILNLLKFKSSFSQIEVVALLYPVSLAVIAIMGTIMLILVPNLRGLIMILLITLLLITSLLITLKRNRNKIGNQHTVTLKNQDFVLLIILIFFVFFYLELYPGASHLLGLDIADNFCIALSWAKDTPKFFRTSRLYPLFNVFHSSIIHIARPSVEVFQTLTVFFNVLTVLTFYIMASQYLKKFGEEVAAMATLIWGLFSGFGWLNFMQEKIINPETSMLWLIRQANLSSYGDITWKRLFFNLSMETSLTLTFALLYLLKREDLSTKKLILLMVLLIAPLPLMHSYATYFLFSVLTSFAIIGPINLKSQLKYSAISILIALPITILLNYILSITAPNVPINYFTYLEYLLLSLALLLIVNLRGRSPKNLTEIKDKILRTKHFGVIAVSLLLTLYLASMLLWFSGQLQFNFFGLGLNKFGYVPWFLYPVKIGVAGILAIIAVYLIFWRSKTDIKEMAAILVSAILMIFISRLISMIQMKCAFEFTFNPNFWPLETIRQNILAFREERMFELFKIPIAIIASLTLSRYAFRKMRIQKSNLKAYLKITGVASLILISGISSTILGFEYYSDVVETSQPSSYELSIIRALQNIVYADGKSIIISPQTPHPYLDFTGATAIVTESLAAWESKSPELPLFVTRYTETTPTYIYLHKTRDLDKLSGFSGNYLEHICNIAPAFLQNAEVQIKMINNWSLPTPKSLTALVVPHDKTKMTILEPFYLEEYEQYTVLALFFEESMKWMNTYQEPISYNDIKIANATAVFNGKSSYIRANGTNVNFERIVVEFEFQPLNVSKNQVIVSKFGLGSLSQKSWEIAQYGKRIAFKISPDGKKEYVLTSSEILQVNATYLVKCEYDGDFMRISINDKAVTSKPYREGIYKSDVDLLIGAELHNDRPTAYANMMLRYIRIMNEIPITKYPIFYAYDFLSSSGVNYTTVLSSDNALSSYITLILPYDDVTTYEILDKFLTTENTNVPKCVIILNTNGYGPLLNLFGKVTKEKFTANQISVHNKYITTSTPLKVVMIEPYSDIKIESEYVNGTFSSPLIMMDTENQPILIYADIYPLIMQNQHLNTSINQNLVQPLTEYLENYDETRITTWFTTPSLLFTKLRANGTIFVRSKSIILNQPLENELVNTETDNVVQINSTQITVQGGYGFYTRIALLNPTIRLSTNKISYTGNLTVILRQPEISIDGIVEFENFYMVHPSTIYTDGRKTTLKGNLTIHVYVSDEYTIALPYKLNSIITVKYEKPIMEFDETTSLLLLTPWLIVVLILFTTYHLLGSLYRGNNPPIKKNLTK